MVQSGLIYWFLRDEMDFDISHRNQVFFDESVPSVLSVSLPPLLPLVLPLLPVPLPLEPPLVLPLLLGLLPAVNVIELCFPSLITRIWANRLKLYTD